MKEERAGSIPVKPNGVTHYSPTEHFRDFFSRTQPTNRGVRSVMVGSHIPRRESLHILLATDKTILQQPRCHHIFSPA